MNAPNPGTENPMTDKEILVDEAMVDAGIKAACDVTHSETWSAGVTAIYVAMRQAATASPIAQQAEESAKEYLQREYLRGYKDGTAVSFRDFVEQVACCSFTDMDDAVGEAQRLLGQAIASMPHSEQDAERVAEMERVAAYLERQGSQCNAHQPIVPVAGSELLKAAGHLRWASRKDDALTRNVSDKE